MLRLERQENPSPVGPFIHSHKGMTMKADTGRRVVWSGMSVVTFVVLIGLTSLAAQPAHAASSHQTAESRDMQGDSGVQMVQTCQGLRFQSATIGPIF